MTPKTNDTPEQKATVPQTETPREKFERERMNRRTALAKIGLRAGATAFAFLAVDDIARLVIGRMAENKEMRQVADSLGREFKNAGVAFADDDDSSTSCAHCCKKMCDDIAACSQSYYNCIRCDRKDAAICDAESRICVNDYNYAADQCFNAHCQSSDPPCPTCAAIPDKPCDGMTRPL